MSVVRSEVENDAVALYREARKAVMRERATNIFAFHVAAYIASLALLGGLNMLTISLTGFEVAWFFIPLIFWGIGLIIHYVIGVALHDDWWDRDESVTRERLRDFQEAEIMEVDGYLPSKTGTLGISGEKGANMRETIGKLTAWKSTQWRDERGITGPETAIILIAFVVVASVFAFAVLTTGLLSSEKAKEVTLSALEQTESTLALRGGVVGVSDATNTSLVNVRFQLNTASAGSGGVNLSATSTILSYQDDDQFLNLTASDWTATWLIGTGPMIDPGEAVDISVDLSGLSLLLGASKEFTVQIKPSKGAVLIVNRTTPAELRPVNDLG